MSYFHADILAILSEYAGYNTMLRLYYKKYDVAYRRICNILYKKYRFDRNGSIYLGSNIIYKNLDGLPEYRNYVISSRLYKCILYYRNNILANICMYSINDRDNIKITIFYNLIKRKIRIKVYIDRCNRVIYRNKYKKN